jgi:hypothetical protein
MKSDLSESALADFALPASRFQLGSMGILDTYDSATCPETSPLLFHSL